MSGPKSLRAQAMLAASALFGLWNQACGDGQVATTSGLNAKLRVAGGEYIQGSFPAIVSTAPPAPAPDGGVLPPPTVSFGSSPNNTVHPGEISKSISIIAAQNTRTVAVGLASDPGYWIVPVSVRSIEFAPNFEVALALDFDRSIAPGKVQILFAAADEEKRYGPAGAKDFAVSDDVPVAPFVVSLRWTADMDLDLLVVRPDGTLLSNKAVRAASDDPNQRIDFDSNIGCQIDGHRIENAIFNSLSAGLYQVYVRTSSACGIAESGWTVRLLRDGQEISRTVGVSDAWEVDLPNGGPEGPGRFATSFSIGD